MTHDNQALDVGQADCTLFGSPKSFGFDVEVRPARIRISGNSKNIWGIGIYLPFVSTKTQLERH